MHAHQRSDYITALALSRSHAGNPNRSYSHPKHDMPKRRKPTVIIPDLRFEPTYLAKLAAADPGWQSVVWVTMRDQVVSPLLQGVLWCVPSTEAYDPYVNLTPVYRGTAAVFIQPLLRSVFGVRSQQHAPKPVREGSAAGWLRQWARALFFPDARVGTGTR